MHKKTNQKILYLIKEIINKINRKSYGFTQFVLKKQKKKISILSKRNSKIKKNII